MTDKSEVRKKVAAYIASNPTIPIRVMAAKLGCSESTLFALAKEHGIHRKPRRITADALALLEADQHNGEVVNG